MADEFVTVSISGLDSLQKKMEQLPDKIAKRSLRRAVRAGAAKCMHLMLSLIPKKTGFLAENLKVRTRLSKEGLAITAKIQPTGKVYPQQGNRQAQIPASLVARLTEFGSEKQSAKHWMTSGFEGSKEDAVEAITEVLREEIENAINES